MYYKKELGNKGEQIATDFLIHQNYEIIENNFTCKIGEIDIIAYDKNVIPNEIVFVEVKSRIDSRCGNPAEAVDSKKRNHIYRTAEYYLYINELENEPCRFDVIEIINHALINHIKKAILDAPKKG